MNLPFLQFLAKDIILHSTPFQLKCRGSLSWRGRMEIALCFDRRPSDLIGMNTVFFLFSAEEEMLELPWMDEAPGRT